MRAPSAWYVAVEGIAVPVAPGVVAEIVTRTVRARGIEHAARDVGRLLDGQAVGVTPGGELTLRCPPGAEPCNAG